jgi:hypothetical protein
MPFFEILVLVRDDGSGKRTMDEEGNLPSMSRYISLISLLLHIPVRRCRCFFVWTVAETTPVLCFVTTLFLIK